MKKAGMKKGSFGGPKRKGKLKLKGDPHNGEKTLGKSMSK